ncbi:MAG TPA: TadE/TadG family type IV pilus assembly protein [Candidatus Acidoferrales bacterium]|nr:TadE/TadG family type IV pilus assembly protein [Candidatus Acidoferrales bacterium]
MKTPGRKPRARSQAGQSIAEVALLTPILLAMLLGAVEFGRYAYIGILVGSAARAGAAYATEHLANAGNTAAIQQAADNDYQNNGQNQALLTVTSTDTCGCDNGSYPIVTQSCFPGTGGAPPTCSPGSHWVVVVSVTASGTYSSLFTYPWIPNSITLTRTSTMRAPLN